MATLGTLPILGKHLTFTLTPQTSDTVGVLTAGTPIVLTGVIDHASESHTASLEEVSPITSPRKSYFVTDDDSTYSLTIFRTNKGTDPNVLKTTFLAYDYFSIAFVEGTGLSARTTTVYGVRETLSADAQSKGKQLATLSFRQIDVGASTFTVA